MWSATVYLVSAMKKHRFWSMVWGHICSSLLFFNYEICIIKITNEFQLINWILTVFFQHYYYDDDHHLHGNFINEFKCLCVCTRNSGIQPYYSTTYKLKLRQPGQIMCICIELFFRVLPTYIMCVMCKRYSVDVC